MCIGGFPECVSLHHVCVHWLKRPQWVLNSLELGLQMTVICLMGTRNWSQVFWKCSQCSKLLSHCSSSNFKKFPILQRYKSKLIQPLLSASSMAFNESYLISYILPFCRCCAKWFVSMIIADSPKLGHWMCAICFWTIQWNPPAWLQWDVTPSVLAPSPHLYDWNTDEFKLHGLHRFCVPWYPLPVVNW